MKDDDTQRSQLEINEQRDQTSNDNNFIFLIFLYILYKLRRKEYFFKKMMWPYILLIWNFMSTLKPSKCLNSNILFFL